jgi:pyrimidine-specific ribonucleoside hydrolase
LVIAMGGSESARFARHMLDLAGRSDVAVVASSAPSTPALAVAGLIPSEVPVQPTDVRSAVRAITGAGPYLVVWGNSGPVTDLADALHDDSQLAQRVQTYVAAGPWDAEEPQFASDGPAAAFALATVRTPDVRANHPQSAVSPPLPPALLTAEPQQLHIGPESPLRQRLNAPDAPAWARLLARHLDQWFDQGHPFASLYPALLVGSLVGAPLTQTDVQPVKADDAGRIHVDPDGVEIEVTVGLADYFITVADWVDNQLRDAIAEG